MQPHYKSCEQWHVRGPRVQQYLLSSNSKLNITVCVIFLCWDLAVSLSVDELSPLLHTCRAADTRYGCHEEM